MLDETRRKRELKNRICKDMKAQKNILKGDA